MKAMLNLKCPIQDVYQKKVGFVGKLLYTNAFVHKYFANFVPLFISIVLMVLNKLP
jgi:lipid-A-disaccharide synthase-like uncharacterized protein